jgi:hypothetical protein
VREGGKGAGWSYRCRLARRMFSRYLAGAIQPFPG